MSPIYLFRFLALSIIMSINSISYADNYIPTEVMNSMKAAPQVNIYGAKHPFPGILSGGQPTQEELKTAKAEGFKTIVNLRMPNEMTQWDEPSKVRALGMSYIAIPVGSADDISIENSDALIAVLEKKENYPVMVHCASGNRVGALFAMHAYHKAKLSSESALKIGREAGLTRLESVVADKLK